MYLFNPSLTPPVETRHETVGGGAEMAATDDPGNGWQPENMPVLFRFMSNGCKGRRRFFERKILPCGFLFVILQPFSASGRRPRRDAGVVDRGGLENR